METPSTAAQSMENAWCPARRERSCSTFTQQAVLVDKARWAQPKMQLGHRLLEQGAEEIVDVAGRTTFPDGSAPSTRAPRANIRRSVSAMDAIAGKPANNIKVILHGEEEGGGPALDYVVKNHTDKLRSDVLIVVDGPQHPTGRPTVYNTAHAAAQPLE